MGFCVTAPSKLASFFVSKGSFKKKIYPHNEKEYTFTAKNLLELKLRFKKE